MIILLMRNYTWESGEIPREVPQNVDLTKALPFIIIYHLKYVTKQIILTAFMLDLIPQLIRTAFA